MREINFDSETSSAQMKIQAVSLSKAISLLVQGNFLNSSLADIPFCRETSDSNNYFAVKIFLVMILIFRQKWIENKTIQ